MTREVQPIPKAGKRRKAKAKPDGGIREAVWRRAGGQCEARLEGCEGSGRLGFHHRFRPGRVDTVENLVLVCQSCHTDSPRAIHRNEAWAYESGLLVRSSGCLPPAPWAVGIPHPINGL